LQNRIEEAGVAQVDEAGAKTSFLPAEFAVGGSPYYVGSDGGAGGRGRDQTEFASLNERPHRDHFAGQSPERGRDFEKGSTVRTRSFGAGMKFKWILINGRRGVG